MLEKGLEININATTESTSNDNKYAKYLELYRPKEIANISDKSYQLLKNCGAEFPSINFVVKCRNKLSTIFKTYENSLGFYCDPEEKIRYFFKILAIK